MTTDIERQPPKPFLYRTTNRGLAAALMALGFELMEVEHGHDQVSFTFPVSRMLFDAVDAYVLDTLSVSAFRMGEAVDRLDDLISGHGAPDEVDLDDL